MKRSWGKTHRIGIPSIDRNDRRAEPSNAVEKGRDARPGAAVRGGEDFGSAIRAKTELGLDILYPLFTPHGKNSLSIQHSIHDILEKGLERAHRRLIIGIRADREQK